MKREQLLKYFENIKIRTKGDNSSDHEIIDYENGQSISLSEIENEYNNYLDLQDEIDDYIEENDLDDVSDRDKIVKHFVNIDENLFKFNQAVLEDFDDYMIAKINNNNENIRKANIIFGKNGNGFISTKITIPVPWTKELGFTENDKSAIIELKNNQIIIKKDAE